MSDVPDFTPVVQETKPGVRTTEFWFTAFSNALGAFSLVGGDLDVNNKWVILALAIINGAYAASRGIAKSGIPAPIE